MMTMVEIITIMTTTITINNSFVRAISRGNQMAVSCFLKKGAKLSSSTWLTAEDKPDIQ